MTTKIWTAQSALFLTDPAGWSPAGMPAASDKAIQSRGVSLGNSPFAATLHFGGSASDPPTLNIDGDSQPLSLVFGDNPATDGTITGHVNINYGGLANIVMTAPGNVAGSLTENISYRGTSGGTLTMQGSRLGSLAFTVSGSPGNGARYTHTGNTTVGQHDTVTLNATTIGTGAWNVGFLGTLTALQPLSQSVTDSGGWVNLLDAPDFTGTLHMQANSGEVQLGPLFADQAVLQGGVLTLSNAGTTLAAIKVTGTNYNVWETSTGVQLGGRNFVPAGSPSSHTLLLHV